MSAGTRSSQLTMKGLSPLGSTVIVIRLIGSGEHIQGTQQESIMNARTVALIAVFVAFSVLTNFAVYHHGYIGVFEAAFANLATTQVAFDLLISISLFGGWMFFDAKKRETTVWPYLVAIPFVGSFSPLAYLIVREWTRR